MLASRTARIIAGVLLFLAVFVLSFPYRNLRGYLFGKIHKATRIYLTSEDLGITIFGWPGLVLDKATAIIPMPAGGDMELSAERVVVRVGIGSFFPPGPSISLSFKKLKGGGDLWVWVAPSRSRVKVSIESSKLNLAQFPIPGLGRGIGGIADIDADVVANLNDAAKSTGDASLDVKGLLIPAINLQGFPLPQMRFGDLKSKLGVKNGAVDFSGFRFGGKDADVTGSASGELRLAQDILDSQLNLTLRLELAEKYRSNPQGATIVSGLAMFQGTDPNRYGLRWNNTLRAMSENVLNAIPQKAE